MLYIEDEVYATLHIKYLGESPNQQKKKYQVHSAMAHSLVNGLMDAGFDPAWSRKTRIEAGLGHAFGRVLHFLMPERSYPIVPIMVNTFYPPAPTPRRCLEFGKALRQTITASTEAKRVVVLASGGLSHVKIDEHLDHRFIEALKSYDESYLGGMSPSELVEGTSELRNWIITAAVAGKGITMIDYVPCYRTMRGIGCAMGFGYWN
jgi:OH-DDVA oxygenase/3-O-methylgallate 3,4-dioxygenase